jgi:hypothetical protein
LVEKFIPLPIVGVPPSVGAMHFRINAFGSLFYFIKFVLKRGKLTTTLHLPVCSSLEKDHIKDVWELPRDHFKSTICTEGLPMWWALPFLKQDEDNFVKLGYSDNFINWMKRVHKPDVRNLLVSENITNAAKLGSKVRYHFESNDRFRALFPEVLPDTSCTWSNYSLHVKLPAGFNASHGEGTFDFLGVGGALQSRHYDNIIEDDLVGRKAIESQSVMDKTIDYHRLVVGAYENDDKDHEGNEIIVGNRWSYHDLSSYIREHEDWFNVVMHSALGGCCPLHQADTPIFPEHFSFEKLMKIKERLGSYHFSCQYLNNPAAPENADFKPEWLGYYELKEDVNGEYISHAVKDGTVKRDVRLNHLRIAMTVDPAHSGNAGAGRCRHAIIVLGLSSNGDYYLLQSWAKACGYDEFIKEIYSIAMRWKVTKFGLETIAAQKFLAYHIQFLNRLENRNLRIIELKGEVEGPDGELTRKKEWRIRNVLLPIFEAGRFYAQRKHQDFIGEYTTFPKGRFVDQLDALAYAPQMITLPQKQEFYLAAKQQNQRRLREVNAPYCGAIN